MIFSKQFSSDDEKSLSLQEAHSLPAVAMERINRYRSKKTSSFSSNLSSQEFLLVKEIGAEPLAMVMGTSFYNICLVINRNTAGNFAGYGWENPAGFELDDLTNAQQRARKLAISRMQKEAELLGASGVINVKFERTKIRPKKGIFEFKAIGTAIRLPGWKENTVFTTALSAQDFWRLYQNGYKASKLSIGVSAYYIWTDDSTSSMLYKWLDKRALLSKEMKNYSIGFSNARALCMKRLQMDASAPGVEGIVGTNITHHIENIEYELYNIAYHDLLINFFAYGTAIDASSHHSTRVDSPLMYYDLLSKERKPLLTESNTMEI